MNRLRQDLLYALRTFAKAPGFTVIAVLVLAVGIGANTAMFTAVNELLIRPRSGRMDQLVGLYSRDRATPDAYHLFSYRDYQAARERRDLFSALAAQTFAMVATSGAPEKPRVFASVVSSNYFETLGVTLAAGRPFYLEEERPGARIRVAIASYARWQRAGLPADMAGRHVTLNGADYEIIGVAPQGFAGTIPILAPDVYLPLGVFDAVVSDRFKNNGRGLADPANEGLSVFGQLAGGRSAPAAAPALDVLSAQLTPMHPGNRADEIRAYPMSRFSAGPVPQTNSAIASLSVLLLTLSGLVLVIACLNIANMLLARGTARRKELAVRLALGAWRGRIIRQLLTENVLLAVAAAGTGLLFSYWAMSAFTSWLSSALPFNLNVRSTPDPLVLVVTLALAAIATMGFGLGPALKLSRRNLVADLKDRGGDDGRRTGWFATRNLLVTGQIALSMALITAGGMFLKPISTSASATPGFSYDQLILASVDTSLAGLDPARSRATYAELMSRLRSTPGVIAATLASTIPFGDNIDRGRFERVGSGAQTPVRARAFRIVGADYFRTLGLPLLRGREFTPAEETTADTPRVAIVDEAFAKQLFGNADPIGQLIRAAPADAGDAAGPSLEIVGVAPPLQEELLDRAPAAHVFVPFGQAFRAGMHAHVKLAPGVQTQDALEAVRRVVLGVDQQLPVLALTTFQEFHNRSVELLGVQGAAAVFAGLAALALILSVVGVYGLRSYLVAQRTREIGIRMALGAGGREVIRLMLGDGVRLTAVGVSFGLPLAVITSLAFRSVFVDVGGVDLAILTASTMVLSVAAVVASAIPARRAAKVEPLTALRQD